MMSSGMNKMISSTFKLLRPKHSFHDLRNLAQELALFLVRKDHHRNADEEIILRDKRGSADFFLFLKNLLENSGGVEVALQPG